MFRLYPMLFWAFFWIIGILIAEHFFISLTEMCLVLFSLFSLIVGMHFFILKQTRGFVVFNVFFALFITLCASYRYQTVTVNNELPLLFFSDNERLFTFQGRVIEQRKDYFDKANFIIEVYQIDSTLVNTRILVNAPKSEVLTVGNRIQWKGNIVEIRPPNHPWEFSFKDYLRHKGVVGRSEIYPLGYKQIDDNHWRSSVASVREKLALGIENSGVSDTSQGILKALLIGKKSEIDAQTGQVYADAGVMHILAISGLHVGILLLLFRVLTKPLIYLPFGKWIQTALLIILLWCFAFIAGMSASVTRAVTMFSFVALGMAINQKGSIFNTLALSAVLLLFVDPHLLFDVGFQLSYIAVLGIVIIQPLLVKMYQGKNQVMRYFVDVFTVSVAAQLAVLPISLYYFHQFPALFFVSNLFVIPLITVILFMGMLSVPFFFTEIQFRPLFWLLDQLIQGMNFGISTIASVEGWVFKDIPFTLPLVISTYLGMLLMFWIWKRKSKLAFVAVSGCMFWTSFTSAVAFWHQNQRSELWILHDYKTSALLHLNGNALETYNLDTIRSHRTVKNLLQKEFVNEIMEMSLQSFISVRGIKVAVMDSLGIVVPNAKPDVLWLRKTPQVHFEAVLKEYQPKIVVADGTNSKKMVALWKKSCDKMGVPFHSTFEKGGFRVE
jgi:competence protein ComEC